MLGPPAKVFVKFCEGYWQLSPSLTRTLWQAFRQATSPTARTLRHVWLLYDSVDRIDPHALIHVTCSPKKIIEALEALVEETLLTRSQATEAEEAMLSHVQADGTWR
jgi:hypothetical protein